MTRHRSLLTLGVLMAALLLVAVACGDDATATPAPTSSPAAGIDTQELQDIISAAIKASVPAAPEVVTAAQIQSMVETAVAAVAPEGASPTEIQALVETAVAAAAGEGLTSEDVAALVSSAVADAISDQPEPLTAAEIEAIVKAAQPPTPTPAPTPTPQPTATAIPAPTEAPKAPVSNRLKVIAAQITETHDPFSSTDANLLIQFFPTHDALIRFNELKGFDPMLAQSWEATDGLKTWTFNLNQGVQFHKDWGELTSRDVLHTMQRAAREGGSVKHGDFFRDQAIPGFVINDDYQFSITLPAGKLDMEEEFSNNWYTGILSKDHFDAEGPDGTRNNPIGTGPYQFVEWERGVRKLYERVPYDHYRITPDFEELEIFFVPESATRMAMMLTNAGHMAQLSTDLERTAVGAGLQVILATTPSIHVYVQLGGVYREEFVAGSPRAGDDPDLPFSDLHYEADQVPWVNQKVRRALNHAIDRETINATLLDGRGTRMMISHFRPGKIGYNPQWEEDFDEFYGYDQDLARQLLAEAEEEIGQPLDFSQVIFALFEKEELPGVPDIGEAVIGMWREVGVEIPVEQFEWGVFLPHFFDMSQAGAAHANAVGEFGDPLFLFLHYYSKGFCCVAHEDDRFDTLFEQLPPDDLVVRDDLVRQIGDIAFYEHVWAPLYIVPASVVVDPRVVEDYKSNMTWGMRDLEFVKAVIR